MLVIKRDGTREPADRRKVLRSVERACRGLPDVDPRLVTDEACQGLFDGVTTADIDRATVLSAKARIPYEPNYSLVAARLLLYATYRESFGKRVDGRTIATDVRHAFVTHLKSLAAAGVVDPRMLEAFDLDALASALRPERDLDFKYLGMKTLHDRYLLRLNRRILETPQAFWMRVAMGVNLGEPDPTAAAIETYGLTSSFRYSHATPTLFNAGTTRPQMSSCFLSTLDDSIDGIYGTLHGQARLSKFAGGLGMDVTPIRGAGAFISGTGGDSQGLVPWLKQFNDMCLAVNQGGKRPGKMAVYLEPWHADTLEFLDVRKETGDDRRRCHDLHTALWFPDLFFKQVEADGDWYFFSPDECPELHETFGPEFERHYWAYAERAEAGGLRVWGKCKAKELLKKILLATKETGHPWWTFKDAFNVRYANRHVGIIKSSNLCTEIGEHAKPSLFRDGEKASVGETAVCNLASVNLAAHLAPDGGVDWAALAATVRSAVRRLDDVIDGNFYPTAEARNSNLLNRPVGLGVMGWADFLHAKGVVFDSPEAERLADETQAFISYHAIDASADLARERGAYPNFPGSLWSQGKLPIDTHAELMALRGEPVVVQWTGLDWASLREKVAGGIRNGLLQAVAPTATIANIVGCSEGIDPYFSNLHGKSTLSGDSVLVNEHLVRELKSLGLWSRAAADALLASDGDVQGLDLPRGLKERFKTAFQWRHEGVIDAAAARQKWICQGQSFNIYYAGDSMRALKDIYFYAWRKGLKSTYYLHTPSASRVEKSVRAEPQQCRIDNPECEACQ